MLSGLKSEYDERHLERINKEIAEHGGHVTETQVQCYDLNDILIKNNLKNIDFISIDTEGGELKILNSINFSIIKVKVIVIENNYSDPDILTFMRKKGFYRVTNFYSDEIYLNPKNFGIIKSFMIKSKLKLNSLYANGGRLYTKFKSAF